jgi:hypothetical protein
MKIPERLRVIPQNVYVLIFSGIFVISCLFVYFLSEDIYLLERKIQSRQKDYAEVLRLRDIYESRRRAVERTGPGQVEKRPVTLSAVEEMVTKNFVGGSLAALNPVTNKVEKGAEQAAVEIKVTNAPLGEIVSFIKTADSLGFYVGKLRLSLPANNPGALDMQATVMERRSNG